jgi:hypothetical protein
MSIYKSYNLDELDALFSNYLLDSWSYSKVTSFARNEKAFEMNYLFGVYSKTSATTIAGQAYHKALDYFFTNLKQGVQLDIVELELAAFAYIDEVRASSWKIQKTTPTIDDCIKKATTTVTLLLSNFFYELSTYTDDIESVLDVEIYCDEFLTINGVDIPLPCHARIDLVLKLKNGYTVIVDHKSKSSYTNEEEIALSIGGQAITYVKCYEAKTGIKIDEVWFIENKYSKNKDGSPQLNAYKITLDENTRRLYEALIYEPLKRTIEAVSDPNYTYLINESDNFIDKAELYDFWARTMICEVEDFNVPEAKKELISKRLKKIRDASISTVTPSVIKKFKENASQFIQYDLSNKNMTQEEKIEHALRNNGMLVKVEKTFDGYSSDTYLLDVSVGVKIGSIYSRRLDIANQLDVENVRISPELIKHENKSYLGIDVSKKRTKDLFFEPKDLDGMKIPLGKDNFENIIYWDLENQVTPYTLVCGAAGSGKSVFINSVVQYAKLAGVSDIIFFDPKYEFRHLQMENLDVINEIEDIEAYMAMLVEQMNMLVKHGRKKLTLVVFDEFADAIAQSKKGKALDGAKSLEENLQILLQKGRSSGFRILCAAQRLSVKILNGDAKANFSNLICFRVPKEIDSKVVIDEGGAEQLQGNGDGLIKSPTLRTTTRFQSYYKP